MKKWLSMLLVIALCGAMFTGVFAEDDSALLSLDVDEAVLPAQSAGDTGLTIEGEDVPVDDPEAEATGMALSPEPEDDAEFSFGYGVVTVDALAVRAQIGDAEPLVEIAGGDVSMVALDGFRLAMKRSKCGDLLEKVSAIIPGRAVGDIGKLLSDEEEAFTQLSFGGNKLHIKLDKTDIFVILVEGEYVQYRQILPPRFATRVVVELEPFRRGIDRAALIAREGNNNLLILKIADGEMAIEAHSQIGDVYEKLEVQQEGADLNIAFNVKYLTDVVRFIDSDQIEINLNNAISPCIITPLGDQDYVHLVLPVRTGATN